MSNAFFQRSLSVFLCRIFVTFFFQFQPYFHHNQSYNLIETDTFVLAHDLEYLLLSLDYNMDEQNK